MRLDRFENGVWIVKYEDPDLLNEAIEFRLITCNPAKIKLCDEELDQSAIEFMKIETDPTLLKLPELEDLLSNMKVEEVKDFNRKMAFDDYHQICSYTEFISIFSLRVYLRSVIRCLHLPVKLKWEGLEFLVFEDNRKTIIRSNFQFVGKRHPVAKWTLGILDVYIDLKLNENESKNKDTES